MAHFVPLCKYSQLYRTLTLKNRVKKQNTAIEYEVWLQVKIAYANGFYKNLNEAHLEYVCRNINQWIDKLIHFDKIQQYQNIATQLSLFGGEEIQDDDNKPQCPTKEHSEKSWTKYWNDIKKYNLKQLEKFSFFEVCPLFGYSYGTYFDIDFRKHLPKSNKEMIELVKDAIIKGTTSEKGHGRFDDFWGDDEYKSTRDGALSDYEIISRVKRLARLYLVPYKQDKTVSVDLSFNFNIINREIGYRFYSNGEEISSIGHHWYSIHLPKYDLYDSEFVSWLREYFNIPQKDMATDDEILKEGVVVALNSMLWHGADKYDVVNKIRGFKDWKQFKADFYSFIKSHNIDTDGGCGSGSIDGFSINFQKNNTKPELTIKQNIKARELSGANTQGFKIYNNYYIVYHLVGDELFKVAFEILTKGSKPTQTNLFDFI